MTTLFAEPRKLERRAPFRFCSLGRVSALGVTALIATGCASSAGQTTAVPQRTTLSIYGTETVIHTEAGVGERPFAAPAAAVWGSMVDVYAQLEIPVAHLDPASMEIGNLRFQPRRIEGRRLSNYIDCGTNFNGALANLHEVTMSIMTRVESVTPDSSRVTTVMDAFAVPRSVSGNQVHCESELTLEERVAELVAEKLAGEG